jgi:hypothetical protein
VSAYVTNDYRSQKIPCRNPQTPSEKAHKSGPRKLGVQNPRPWPGLKAQQWASTPFFIPRTRLAECASEQQEFLRCAEKSPQPSSQSWPMLRKTACRACRRQLSRLRKEPCETLPYRPCCPRERQGCLGIAPTIVVETSQK